MGTAERAASICSAPDVGSLYSTRLWAGGEGRSPCGLLSLRPFEFDCNGRRLRTGSSVAYDSKGKVTSSSDDAGYWSSVIPDTIGEQLYNGACSKSF